MRTAGAGDKPHQVRAAHPTVDTPPIKCARATHHNRPGAQLRFTRRAIDTPNATAICLKASIYEAYSQRNKTGTQPA
jgi:hypothetical protein